MYFDNQPPVAPQATGPHWPQLCTPTAQTPANLADSKARLAPTLHVFQKLIPMVNSDLSPLQLLALSGADWSFDLVLLN